MTAAETDRMPAPAQSLPCPPALSGLPRPAVFFDFDGTLVEIAGHPDSIVVAPGLPAMLERLDKWLDGRLAIVSGRSLADLDRFLGPLPVAMAGSHGGEMREAGSKDVQSLSDPLPASIVSGLHRIADAHGGLLVEPKPFSAAIHYREKPSAEADVLDRAGALADEGGLVLKRGKMVAELVMPGSDKGRAVRTIMEKPGFTGARPVFLGDDITDEDAFKAVLELGGEGILVGPQRETAALWRLEGVDDVHAWLGQALDGDQGQVTQ